MFNETNNSLLGGIANVTGPFEVWLIPSWSWCDLFSNLTGYALPCPLPVEVGQYSWHSTILPGGLLNFSTLGENFSGFPAGNLPPQPWSIFVVDMGPTQETATVLSPVAVTAL
jgi:hypothetical protein